MKKRKSSSGGARPGKKLSARPDAQPRGPAGQDEISQSGAFRKATLEAESYARDPERLRKLCLDAIGKINRLPRGPFAETWPYLLAMIRLIRAYRQREYLDTPSEKLLIVVAAIIYFVSPFDVIPDWVPVLGHIDDAFVISLALKSVRADLDTFMTWETSRV